MALLEMKNIAMRFGAIEALAGPHEAGQPKADASFREISFPGVKPPLPASPAPPGRNEVFLIGAGAYACAYILPALSGLTLDTIVDLNPGLAALVSERFKFRHRDTSAARAFERLIGAAEPIVVVAGYHSSHAEHAAMAIAANPDARVLVEKPPALDIGQAARLAALRDGGTSPRNGNPAHRRTRRARRLARWSAARPSCRSPRLP